MDEESRRELLQGLRHCQGLLQQFSREADAQVLHASDDVAQPSAGGQRLAGAGEYSAEALRNHHDDSPGNLQDPRTRAIMETLYNDNDLILRDYDNEPVRSGDGGGSFDGNGDDGVFGREDEEDSEGDGFHPFIGSEDFIRFAEIWEQGLREEAAHYFLSRQRVELDLDVVEQFTDMAASGLADAEDDEVVLEWVNEAVANGRLVVQITSARLSVDESYDGGGGSRGIPASSAAVAGLEKLKYQQDLGDDHRECSICLEDYASGDDLSVIPCTYRHRYHQGCLAAWLERNNVCPLCRHALPTDQEQELGVQFEPH